MILMGLDIEVQPSASVAIYRNMIEQVKIEY